MTVDRTPAIPRRTSKLMLVGELLFFSLLANAVGGFVRLADIGVPLL